MLDYLSIALNAVLLLVLLLLLLRTRKGGGAAENEAQLRALQESLQLLQQQSQRESAMLQERLRILQQQTADEFERSRRESGEAQNSIRAELNRSLLHTQEKLQEMTQGNAAQQQQLTAAVSKALADIRRDQLEQAENQSRRMSESLRLMQESNEGKLEQMRATVDEKLQTTLNTRLDSSFKTVSEQLENVYKSLGEMKELSTNVTGNVTSLSRILTNVKARGTWAENQLANILDQTIPNMYERNFDAQEGSRERVEFAVRIPSGDGSAPPAYLPIDSKFPTEDYQRLCDAEDGGDMAEIQRLRKLLEDRVLQEARSITKYIQVPRTTPFAIMYLATEGLYAAIASSPNGLPERLQNEFHVMIAGPITITALLNTIAMGFRTVAINEKANEIRLLLAAAKKQYEQFGGLLDKARKQVDMAGRTLGEAQHRNDIIQKRLKGVETLEIAQAEALLGLPTEIESNELIQEDEENDG